MQQRIYSDLSIPCWAVIEKACVKWALRQPLLEHFFHEISPQLNFSYLSVQHQTLGGTECLRCNFTFASKIGNVTYQYLHYPFPCPYFIYWKRSLHPTFADTSFCTMLTPYTVPSLCIRIMAAVVSADWSVQTWELLLVTDPLFFSPCAICVHALFIHCFLYFCCMNLHCICIYRC